MVVYTTTRIKKKIERFLKHYPNPNPIKSNKKKMYKKLKKILDDKSIDWEIATESEHVNQDCREGFQKRYIAYYVYQIIDKKTKKGFVVFLSERNKHTLLGDPIIDTKIMYNDLKIRVNFFHRWILKRKILKIFNSKV